MVSRVEWLGEDHPWSNDRPQKDGTGGTVPSITDQARQRPGAKRRSNQQPSAVLGKIHERCLQLSVSRNSSESKGNDDLLNTRLP